jgi:hypothetical protein
MDKVQKPSDSEGYVFLVAHAYNAIGFTLRDSSVSRGLLVLFIWRVITCGVFSACIMK